MNAVGPRIRRRDHSKSQGSMLFGWGKQTWRLCLWNSKLIAQHCDSEGLELQQKNGWLVGCWPGMFGWHCIHKRNFGSFFWCKKVMMSWWWPGMLRVVIGEIAVPKGLEYGVNFDWKKHPNSQQIQHRDPSEHGLKINHLAQRWKDTVSTPMGLLGKLQFFMKATLCNSNFSPESLDGWKMNFPNFQMVPFQGDIRRHFRGCSGCKWWL